MENEICEKILSELGLTKLNYILETIIIVDIKDKLLDRVFLDKTLFDEEQIYFLKKVYLIFKKIKIEDNLRIRWLQYIIHYGHVINSSYLLDSVKWFFHLEELKKNIDSTIQDAFLNEDKFKLSGKEGYSKTINYKPNYIADCFSNYLNHLFCEESNEEVIKTQINSFMVLFFF